MILTYDIIGEDGFFVCEREGGYTLRSKGDAISMIKRWDRYIMGDRIKLYADGCLFYDTKHPLKSFFGLLK